MNDLITPPERQATMRLQDGRVLAWSEWGAAEGLPVLFCTAAAMSDLYLLTWQCLILHKNRT